MKTTLGIIFIVTAVLFVVFGYVVFSALSTTTESAIISPSPTITTTSTPEPTRPAAAETITGSISEIIGPVGYKNSLAIRIGTDTVYITEDTEVVGENGDTENRDAIRRNVRVRIGAIPAEGGYEALRMEIVNAASPTRIQPTTTSESTQIET